MAANNNNNNNNNNVISLIIIIIINYKKHFGNCTHIHTHTHTHTHYGKCYCKTTKHTSRAKEHYMQHKL